MPVARFADSQTLNITFEPKANGADDCAMAPLTDPYTYEMTNGYDSALRALGGDSFSARTSPPPTLHLSERFVSRNVRTGVALLTSVAYACSYRLPLVRQDRRKEET